MADTQSPQTVEQCDKDAAERAVNGLKHEFLVSRGAVEGTRNLLTYAFARHRLTTAASQPKAMADQSTEARLRELIARIVDPDAFDALGGVLSNVKAAEAHRKADAIAALSLPIQDTSDELTRLRAEVEAMREALTPSADTKAAYMGEFSFSRTEIDESGDERQAKTYVPWTTIKEIMAAIRARTTLNGEQANVETVCGEEDAIEWRRLAALQPKEPEHGE